MGWTVMLLAKDGKTLGKQTYASRRLAAQAVRKCTVSRWVGKDSDNCVYTVYV
jgi:hypothetical protein